MGPSDSTGWGGQEEGGEEGAGETKGRGDDGKQQQYWQQHQRQSKTSRIRAFTLSAVGKTVKINQNRDDIFICDCCARVCVCVWQYFGYVLFPNTYATCPTHNHVRTTRKQPTGGWESRSPWATGPYWPQVLRGGSTPERPRPSPWWERLTPTTTTRPTNPRIVLYCLNIFRWPFRGATSWSAELTFGWSDKQWPFIHNSKYNNNIICAKPVRGVCVLIRAPWSR